MDKRNFAEGDKREVDAKLLCSELNAVFVVFRALIEKCNAHRLPSSAVFSILKGWLKTIVEVGDCLFAPVFALNSEFLKVYASAFNLFDFELKSTARAA